MWFLPEISDQNDRKCDYRLRVCEFRFCVAALVRLQDVQVVWMPLLHTYQTQFTPSCHHCLRLHHTQNSRMKSRDRLHCLVFPPLSLTITSLDDLTFRVNSVGQPPPSSTTWSGFWHWNCSRCSPSITGNSKRVTRSVPLNLETKTLSPFLFNGVFLESSAYYLLKLYFCSIFHMCQYIYIYGDVFF